MTLDIITHPALAGTQHGFFTRAGGASSGIYAGLNCGFGSADQHEAVSINRNRVSAAMGVSAAHLVGVHQVHSADVITVDGPHATTPPKADALVTATAGVALAILTADCQPVLFADHQNGVIGAAHAGWKGALDGVLEATCAAMVAIGAKPETMTAVIGPCISQRNYEVGPELRDIFVEKDPAFARFFLRGVDDRFLFDLPAFGLDRLAACGIAQAHWTHHCTYAAADRFYSYRRSQHRKEPDYGRLISVIRL